MLVWCCGVGGDGRAALRRKSPACCCCWAFFSRTMTAGAVSNTIAAPSCQCCSSSSGVSVAWSGWSSPSVCHACAQSGIGCLSDTPPMACRPSDGRQTAMLGMARTDCELAGGRPPHRVRCESLRALNGFPEANGGSRHACLSRHPAAQSSVRTLVVPDLCRPVVAGRVSVVVAAATVPAAAFEKSHRTDRICAVSVGCGWARRPAWGKRAQGGGGVALAPRACRPAVVSGGESADRSERRSPLGERKSSSHLAAAGTGRSEARQCVLRQARRQSVSFSSGIAPSPERFEPSLPSSTSISTSGHDE